MKPVESPQLNSLQGQATPATSPTRRRKKLASTATVKLSDNIQEMDSFLQKKLEEVKAEKANREQMVEYKVNPQSKVDEEQFQQAIAKYCESLKAQNKMNLVSILTKGKSQFNFNEWNFVVENEIEMGWLEREKELLPFLRKEIGTADLFMKCKVEETYKNERDKIPYTDEDKLTAMGEKSPGLLDLQRIFKTRIVY